MTLDYEKFILRQTEWRGEVTNKLDNINNEILEIKDDMKYLKNQNREMNKKLTNIRIKNAVLYGSLTTLLSLGTTLIVLAITGVIG